MQRSIIAVESGFLSSEAVSFLRVLPSIAIDDTNIFWANALADHSGDIYSLSYVAGTASSSEPTFANLPNSNTQININRRSNDYD